MSGVERSVLADDESVRWELPDAVEAVGAVEQRYAVCGATHPVSAEVEEALVIDRDYLRVHERRVSAGRRRQQASCRSDRPAPTKTFRHTFLL